MFFDIRMEIPEILSCIPGVRSEVLLTPLYNFLPWNYCTLGMFITLLY
jgi:hypothetical protein